MARCRRVWAGCPALASWSCSLAPRQRARPLNFGASGSGKTGVPRSLRGKEERRLPLWASSPAYPHLAYLPSPFLFSHNLTGPNTPP